MWLESIFVCTTNRGFIVLCSALLDCKLPGSIFSASWSTCQKVCKLSEGSRSSWFIRLMRRERTPRAARHSCARCLHFYNSCCRMGDAKVGAFLGKSARNANEAKRSVASIWAAVEIALLGGSNSCYGSKKKYEKHQNTEHCYYKIIT